MNDKIKTSPYRYEKFTATNDYAFKKIFGTEENKDICEREREMYRAACRYESDRVSMINESERKGIAKGMQAGIAQGRSEGFYQKALETAKLMIAHNYPASEISLMTGLPQEEVEKL